MISLMFKNMKNIFLYDFKNYLDSLLVYAYEDIHNRFSSWFDILFADNDEFKRKVHDLFGRSNRDKNKIKTSLELPNNPNSLPCITLRCPAGSTGDSDIIMQSDTIFDEKLDGRDVFRTSIVKQFDFMCVGKNYEESYIISEVLRALFIGSVDTLSGIMKCEKVTVTTKDLYMENDLTPNVFVRLVSLNVQVPESVPSIVVSESITDFSFNLKAIN